MASTFSSNFSYLWWLWLVLREFGVKLSVCFLPFFAVICLESMKYSPFNLSPLPFIEFLLQLNYINNHQYQICHYLNTISQNSQIGFLCDIKADVLNRSSKQDSLISKTMLAEIPRIPTFPEHMVAKEMRRIEKDVEDDVIPVSAGIYSQFKLVEKLQATPKPDIVSYEDPIFYEIVDTAKYPCKVNECPLCSEEFGSKKNVAVQCYFCGIWNCSNCMCPRKRYHPRAKESNSQRYTICHKCDDKFLNITLHHSYVEQKALLDQVMKRVRKQRDQFEGECEKREKDSNYSKTMHNTNKFKISSLKKQETDCKKLIGKLKSQRESDSMKMGVRQKYLAILMRKKQKMRQSSYAEQKQTSTKSGETNSNTKSIRSLSQSHVYSESIKIDPLPHLQPHDQKQQIIEPVKAQHAQKLSQPEYSKTELEQVEETEVPVPQFSEKATQRKNHIFPQLQPQQQDQQKEQIEVKQSESSKQLKIAQIFSKDKPAEHVEQIEEEQIEELDQQAIKMRKAELMKSAIQESRKSRFETMDQYYPDNNPQKCSCQIY